MIMSFANVLVMFSQDQAGKVGHFGLWSEASSDHQMLRHAFDVLCDAVERCIEQDMRVNRLAMGTPDRPATGTLCRAGSRPEAA